MNKLIALAKKHKEILLYLIFGALTTLVNFVTYFLFYNMLNVSNVSSTIISWAFSVIFAYITNKLFVFESKSFKANVIFREALTFFSARVISGVLDVGFMYLTVDLLLLNGSLCKLASNVFVIILNYIFSKLWIFKK